MPIADEQFEVREALAHLAGALDAIPVVQREAFLMEPEAGYTVWARVKAS